MVISPRSDLPKFKSELDCKQMLKTALDPKQMNITLAAIREVNLKLCGKRG